MTNLHKWKYQDSRKMFLNHKKMHKLLRDKKAVLYDTRSSDKFYNYHFRGAIHVSPIKIRSIILTNHAKTKIVLIHDFERTNVSVASWARFQGYKKVFLFHLNDQLIDKKIFKFHKIS